MAPSRRCWEFADLLLKSVPSIPRTFRGKSGRSGGDRGSCGPISEGWSSINSGKGFRCASGRFIYLSYLLLPLCGLKNFSSSLSSFIWGCTGSEIQSHVYSSRWPFFVCLFVVLGFELRAYTLSHFTNPFLWKVFWDRVSRTICLGWLQTTILLISASWVARITGKSHHAWLQIFLIYRKILFLNWGCSSVVGAGPWVWSPAPWKNMYNYLFINVTYFIIIIVRNIKIDVNAAIYHYL
jgi:hypothetical protein